MEQNTSDKEIISELFVSRDTISERLKSIVEMSKGVVHIIEETGDVLIEDETSLNNAERIFLNLLGKYFSYKSGFCDSPTMQLGDIADKLAVPRTTIPAPMNVLTSDKTVSKSEKGAYQVNMENYKKIKELLQKIRNKIFGAEENVS